MNSHPLTGQSGSNAGEPGHRPPAPAFREAEANFSAGQAALEKLLRSPQPEELAQERAALAQAEAELAGTRQKAECTRLLYEQEAVPKVTLEERIENFYLPINLARAQILCPEYAAAQRLSAANNHRVPKR